MVFLQCGVECAGLGGLVTVVRSSKIMLFPQTMALSTRRPELIYLRHLHPLIKSLTHLPRHHSRSLFDATDFSRVATSTG